MRLAKWQYFFKHFYVTSTDGGSGVFMVHGALLLEKDFSAQKHLFRAIKLFFQLVVWSTIYLLVSLLLGLIPEEISLGFLYHYFFTGGCISGTIGTSLWFIYALISIYIFFPVLFSLKSNRKVLIYLAAILFLFSIIAKEIDVWCAFLSRTLLGESFSLKWWNSMLSPFGRYANCLFFFLLGYLLSGWLLKKNREHSFKRQATISCALILAGILLMMLERKMEFGTFQYNWKSLPEQYMRLGTVFMATGVFALFSAIPFREEKCKMITEISKHTIDIYFVHVIIARIMYIYLFKQSLAGVFPNYIRALFVLFSSYVIGKIIRNIPLIKKIL